MTDLPARPSPEALLKQAARAEGGGRGRLKIFLGAAPGVGKTYAMLSAARQRLAEGGEVVVGLVETHGRAETAALVEGLERVPLRLVAYKGQTLEEMDLDALLARHPGLALVDELAHTNAPGSRHPRRSADVEELLAAGIDVWTTLNIQHLESLNDVVARITRIRVRETVPDSLLDLADEIEVVDITPEDLLTRLREGKVYARRTAARAMAHYFSPGNLTALRELALRRTAESAEARLREHMQAHAIEGPWPAGERILVCVTRAASGAALVRYGRRLAERLHAPWTALFVETPRHARRTEAERDAIADSLRLAEELGGESAVVPGREVPATILAYAREHNFSAIVVGKPVRPRWRRLLRPPVAEAVIAAAGEIPVHVVGGERPPAAPLRLPKLPRGAGDLRPYLISFAATVAATLIGIGLREVLAVGSVALAYLTTVLAVGAFFGLGPSLFACVLGVAAYNFFFLPPLYTFTIADPENVTALVFFLIAALIAGNLASRVRAQALTARTRARTTEQLYQFSRKLAGIGGLDDLLWAVAYQIAAMLEVRVVVLLAEETGGIAVRAGYPPEDALDEADLAAATWCWRHLRPAGRGADTLPGARRLFLPLRTAAGAVGAVGVDRDEEGPPLAPPERRLLDALADQAAVAIERISLTADVERVRLQAETERLRSALLTSLSHDLRTPLAAIVGAASSLQSYHELMDSSARGELLGTIRDEAERLNRFVGNLLDMTRLESGALAPRLEALDPGEAIGAALERTKRLMAGHRVVLDLPPDLPPARLDAVLFEQILFNLLDNAAKYAPAGSTVTLRARPDVAAGHLVVQVIDEGPGIPQEELERVFDKFHRVHGTDHRRAGTGLGLAICRGFVEAMGGRIAATNRPDRSGAIFTLTLALAS